MRTKFLFDAINKRIADEHIKHVQLLLTKVNDRLAFKFVSCDNERYKKIVKNICNNFCESLLPYKETKTALIYLV